MLVSDIGFKEFMAEVDKHLISISGLSHKCLGDYSYRDSYDNDEDPYEVAVSVLEENDYPFDGEPT